MSDWTQGYVTDIDYTYGFYRELSPALLNFAALAKGRAAPNISGKFTYCELGCGQGFSANVLAAANPNGEFYATDFNSTHIAGAQDLAMRAGTGNVHFFDQSFGEFLVEPSLPKFDYIVLHGIYSWVAAAQRVEIVTFLREKLKPGGIVFISYNALPGWSGAAPLRHLMYLHGKSGGGPTIGRLDPALKFAERLQEANAGIFRAYPTLKTRLEKLKGQNRNYLAHEYMNDAWSLFYHSDVVADLNDARVTFIGSGALLEHVEVVNMTTEQIGMMNEATDPVFREVLRDYMVNQQFRRDVFQRGPRALKQGELRERWLGQRFVLSTERSAVPLKVTGAMGEVTLKDSVYNPVIDAFAKGPRTVRDILTDPEVSQLQLVSIQQALLILVGAGHLNPALDREGDDLRRKHVRRLNAAIAATATESDDLQFMASPIAGTGIQVDWFTKLALVARERKEPDTVAFAFKVMKQRGQRMVVDGKTLETDEANKEELAKRAVAFEARSALLKMLGIV